MQDEWTEALTEYNAVVDLYLSDLCALVAEATRELCAEFPQHNCHNGATNNWAIGRKVAEHIRANYKK